MGYSRATHLVNTRSPGTARLSRRRSPRPSHLTPPQCDWPCGEASDGGAGRVHVRGHTRARGDASACGDGDVVGDGGLAPEHAVVSQCRRATERHVSAQQAADTDDDVVADLHQIVHLGVCTDARVAPRAAIDARAGSDLDVSPDHHASPLRLLHRQHVALQHAPDAALEALAFRALLGACRRPWNEAEAVGSDAHSSVQRASAADRAVLQRRVRPDTRPSTHRNR
mmetsp:Transcript_8673/g.25556  ORF Transcript_8673/g.25556 Transcript_8673/m.25556 type:complete len:226 (-) Transcript_8673:195-872(-)